LTFIALVFSGSRDTAWKSTLLSLLVPGLTAAASVFGCCF